MKRKKISRRDFISSSSAAFGLSLIPFSFWPDKTFAAFGEDQEKEPHFFIQIYLNGGADPNSTFDARPLLMTKANLITNYFKEEPFEWLGSNGQKTLATSAVKPLLTYKQDFSIINGILMSQSFDGHDQNSNLLFTGNAFGGECFLPYLNLSLQNEKALLDYVQTGLMFSAPFTNSGGSLSIDPASANLLIKQLKGLNLFDPKDPANTLIKARMQAGMGGTGLFSGGLKNLLASHDVAPVILKQLQAMEIGASFDPAQKQENQFKLMGEFFKKGVARGFLISLNESFDTHDAKSAKDQPANFKKAIDLFQGLIGYLKATPYDLKRSLFDLTTFSLTTEFGRTMRQKLMPSIDESGTDHNPLTNWMLLGGKGIKGGMVVGATDFETETASLSKAHLELDSDKMKIMGKPFDVKTLSVIPKAPEKFVAADYLQCGHVVNTIQKLFQVPPALFRRPSGTTDPYPVLEGLLT